MTTLRPKTLLVVEDDLALRQLWETIFASRGLEVLGVATVAELDELRLPLRDLLKRRVSNLYDDVGKPQ